MDLWSGRPEGGELWANFDLWRAMGYSRNVPGYWEQQSERTILAQDLATPGLPQRPHVDAQHYSIPLYPRLVAIVQLDCHFVSSAACPRASLAKA